MRRATPRRKSRLEVGQVERGVVDGKMRRKMSERRNRKNA